MDLGASHLYRPSGSARNQPGQYDATFEFVRRPVAGDCPCSILAVMSEFHDVVVVGGGQAGLVASHGLTERGVDHVVLERARVGERWRTERWDSLRFQFPNTVLGLPGMPYDGQAPDGYAHHTEVLQRVERYAARVRAPVREHTT